MLTLESNFAAAVGRAEEFLGGIAEQLLGLVVRENRSVLIIAWEADSRSAAAISAETGNPVTAGFFGEARAQPAFVVEDRSFEVSNVFPPVDAECLRIELLSLIKPAILETNRDCA